jgi:hypothetical protein
MSLSDSHDKQYNCDPPVSELERTAWELYCKETAGDMDVRDFWWELPVDVQLLYLDKIAAEKANR